MPALLGIWARIQKNAEGAAMQTETKVEVALTGSVWNVMPNDQLNRLLYRNLTYVGGSHYSAEEQLFAEKLRLTTAKRRNKEARKKYPPSKSPEYSPPPLMPAMSVGNSRWVTLWPPRGFRE
jgi:metal-dependent amidase/aminoacylase/carboxypeptidase family protein